MADVQTQFIGFHDNIKLDDENDTLRSKRDIILTKLRSRMRKLYPDAPTYTSFVQGSYAMSTGVKPLDSEYDIDVGLEFDMNKDNYEPVKVKEWVYECLKDHTATVKVRTPCVTVVYQESGEPAYHVDLTVYAHGAQVSDLYLAKGRLNSSDDKKYWEESDPKGLMGLITGHYDDPDDRAQYRRVIRYMKRWKDIRFDAHSHGSPTGIALTVSAMEFFSPVSEVTDRFTNKKTYRDLKAMIGFVDNMVNAFVETINQDGESVVRLSVAVPTPIYNDLFEKMTDVQMSTLKEELEKLRDALVEADNEVDPVEACTILQKRCFGSNFPVPLKDDTGQKRRLAVTTTSQSAFIRWPTL